AKWRGSSSLIPKQGCGCEDSVSKLPSARCVRGKHEQLQSDGCWLIRCRRGRCDQQHPYRARVRLERYMKILCGVLLSIVAIGCFGLPARAHHSFPATYLVDQEVTLEGELVAFMFRNPHAFVHLNVKEKNGETIR